jgi:hypothetical protein
MTAIWQNDGTGWRLSAPVGFPDEQTLHDLVEEMPQILPSAGNPRLVVVGKEVGLGNDYADIVAVERIAPVQIGQGNSTREVSDELLEALADAYRDAAAGKIGG